MGATGLARGRSHAIRPCPEQEAYEGKDRAANEALAIYFWHWQNCGFEAMFQESLSSRDGDIITSRFFRKGPLGWLAPPALRLVLRYICSKVCLRAKSVTAAHMMAPLSQEPICAVPPQVSWVIFRSGPLLGCLEFKIDSLERDEQPRVVSFHTTVPTASK